MPPPLVPAPLLTFGIPAYNRPQLLAETLTSIASQDTPCDYEVVVCDDGGLAETAATVARFPRDRFFYHRNTPALGPVSNWNECLRRARGQWVMILHEDDALYPWYFRTVQARLRTGLAAVCTKVVSGATAPILAPPNRSPRVRAYPAPYFLKSAMTPFPGVLFPRALGLSLGGFSEAMGPLADYDFWYRLACAGEVEVVRTPAAFYRVAEGQWTERTWGRMLRQTHLLRLRIAREQFRSRRLGRWFARFFTYRNALSYAQRFPDQQPTSLARTLRFGRLPLSSLPSGWAWTALRLRALLS